MWLQHHKLNCWGCIQTRKRTCCWTCRWCLGPSVPAFGEPRGPGLALRRKLSRRTRNTTRQWGSCRPSCWPAGMFGAHDCCSGKVHRQRTSGFSSACSYHQQLLSMGTKTEQVDILTFFLVHKTNCKRHKHNVVWCLTLGSLGSSNIWDLRFNITYVLKGFGEYLCS